MSISDRQRKKLALRDPYCIHCGHDVDLVIHHRKNRGMGGSKFLDVYPNLIRVCQEYNFRMESVPEIAQEAREYGHKLESWQDVSEPVYDACMGVWYQFDDAGGKTMVDAPDGMF